MPSSSFERLAHVVLHPGPPETESPPLPSSVGHLDDELARRSPAHTLRQHRWHVRKRDDGVNWDLQLAFLDESDQLLQVCGVRLQQEVLEEVILGRLCVPEVGDADKDAALLQDLSSLGPVLWCSDAVIDLVVLLARQGIGPVSFLVVDHLIGAQLLHVVDLAAPIWHLVRARCRDHIGTNSLAQLDGDGTGRSRAAQDQHLLAFGDLTQLCSGEVPPSAGEQRLIGSKTC
mmetsp:Transcript_33092/g.79188  ORF Transcript_33092/g.79188 Transcript_33092/m.79188 type:complete len:231 (+) Transcript_33092:20-712(+)